MTGRVKHGPHVIPDHVGCQFMVYGKGKLQTCKHKGKRQKACVGFLAQANIFREIDRALPVLFDMRCQICWRVRGESQGSEHVSKLANSHFRSDAKYREVAKTAWLESGPPSEAKKMEYIIGGEVSTQLMDQAYRRASMRSNQNMKYIPRSERAILIAPRLYTVETNMLIKTFGSSYLATVDLFEDLPATMDTLIIATVWPKRLFKRPCSDE
ncbi:uncharacterized protein FOMMEDRAFT_25093 [Fomitiporia mediterranea MF3/22]|uniref:uncharacterized protein n=1 Tax=Fomitiporia mediterranea (strain MF3/22) TaxID=694068 RepID=UPI0004408F79|nr:uncharacterized protein FOMMEDRAFT_25093 [Fomitiporia mediterranea MF3/22]EJD07827.1 hypothetical protein FOMMEDRAFT_25093 [Fomitiporia mediterranea MF3/22]